MKPVNLNKVRKEKARQARRTKADQNAVKFGRTKAERAAEKAATDAAERHIDGHRRDR